ncbi:hypothetical protein [Bacillus cereus]|uniref:hypothetical protein n=1 Tax=Bacillus cereus TaxID=1396 RepID=UPI000BF81195|nr:hypothetical protein [Bacillus cereus]MCU5273603.1 hypothetical protein [Bacillus cereus]PET96223.1 hypothetical protein CN534_23815 [Bacillus cereus]PEZ54708.1 hypothetical protein CN370_27515 [Bacillus cereus]PFB62381.1 hypothetical protein CN292_27000 [Bacillus cereus]HDR8152411.1 hypothetical protein [Bacillus cereus]
MDFLLGFCIIVILVIFAILFSEFFIPRIDANRKRKTVYDGSIIGLEVTIGLSIVIGVISPFIVYSFGESEQTNAIVQYIGTILGSIISVCGAVLAVIITLKKQKEKQDDELRILTKLKLKNLYSHIDVYLINNNFVAMDSKLLMDDNLIYNYARDFLELHAHVFKELSETSEKLFNIFDKEFEEESKVCLHVLRYEKAKSTTFMAQLLNIYSIFKDDLSKKVFEGENLETCYEYTALQVFLVLESHFQSKLRLFNKEIKNVLEDL